MEISILELYRHTSLGKTKTRSAEKVQRVVIGVQGDSALRQKERDSRQKERKSTSRYRNLLHFAYTERRRTNTQAHFTWIADK